MLCLSALVNSNNARANKSDLRTKGGKVQTRSAITTEARRETVCNYPTTVVKVRRFYWQKMLPLMDLNVDFSVLEAKTTLNVPRQF